MVFRNIVILLAKPNEKYIYEVVREEEGTRDSFLEMGISKGWWRYEYSLMPCS